MYQFVCEEQREFQQIVHNTKICLGTQPNGWGFH